VSVDGSARAVRPARWRGQGTTGSVAYGAALTICLALSVMGLALGALVAFDNWIPSIASRLAAPGRTDVWAAALLPLTHLAESGGQLFLDYAFSVGAIVLALALLIVRDRTWPVRLTALALVASASAFNLQAHVAVRAVSSGGLAVAAPLFTTGLPVVVCGSFLFALALLPTTSARARDRGPALTILFTVVGACALLVIVAATVWLAMPYCCSLLLGAVVPVAGAIVLHGQMRRAPMVGLRTQSRQLFTIMVGALAVAAVLALMTLALYMDGWDGQDLVNPAVGADGPADPIALQFWYSRLICTAIAIALLVTTRRGGSYSAERLFSRGLIAAGIAALVAGGYIVVHSLREDALQGDTALGAAKLVLLGGVPMALLVLPAYVATERLVDWLLYGSHPTPYKVLARVAALAEAPDLARLTEALGQDLGASTCQLTVFCPGLRNSVYNWADHGIDARPDVDIPVWQGPDRVGTIAVDQGTVAILQGRRSHLLDAVADSLGAVFQLHRREIELRHHLGSANTAARRIGESRRAVVAEMAHDRRRIERDLHDGAHPRLRSLRTTLGLAEQAMAAGQPDEAQALLDHIADQADAVDGLRAETAITVTAPLLYRLGLVRALDQELTAGRAPGHLDINRLDESMPIPLTAAAAVYFCCLDAASNARTNAPDAAVYVQLATVAGHLHFAVYNAARISDTSGTGHAASRLMSNLNARVAAVGGWVEVRSSPGTGTVVEGAVPFGPPRPRRTPVRPVPPLIDQVRDVLRQAGRLYDDASAADEIRRLADQLDAPVRIALSGSPGSGITTLAEALRAAFQQRDAGSVPRACFSEAPALPSLVDGGAPIMLLSYVGTDEISPDDPLAVQPALAIGVLARIDEMGAIDPTGNGMAIARRMAGMYTPSDVRGRCAVVVPVAGQLARAAAALNDADLDVLRTVARRAGPTPEPATSLRPTPHHREQPTGDLTEGRSGADILAEVENRLRRRLGTAGVELAVALIGSGQAPTAAALTAALIRSSGMQALVAELDRRLIRRGLGTRARAVFRSLQKLISAQPPARDADRLTEMISALRSGSLALDELDTVAELYATRAPLAADLRAAAALLLGASGPDRCVRLSLADDADQEAVQAAISTQQTYWHDLSSHPATRQSWGGVGAVVVRTCEYLRTSDTLS
jgi:signal transduction histidine kinase